jgi:hypothetical protein
MPSFPLARAELIVDASHVSIAAAQERLAAFAPDRRAGSGRYQGEDASDDREPVLPDPRPRASCHAADLTPGAGRGARVGRGRVFPMKRTGADAFLSASAPVFGFGLERRR